MADGRADVAGDALFLFRKNPVTREARVDVHERGERAGEAAPDASAEPEIRGDADDPREAEIDDVVVIELEAGEGPAAEESAGELLGKRDAEPGEDAEEEDERDEREGDLADHVQPVPARAVRHFLAVGVAERLGERAAGADPAAVGAFAPAPDDERDDDESLHARNGEPPPERLGRGEVPEEERPGEDEAEGAPVLASVRGAGEGEKAVGDGAREAVIEEAIVPGVGEDEVGQEEKRDRLHGHERERLGGDVGRAAAADAPDAKDDDDRGVGDGVVEARLGGGDGERAEERGWIGGLRGDVAAEAVQPVRDVEGKPVIALERGLQRGAAFPQIDKRAEEEEGDETGPRARSPLAADGEAAAAEKIERSLAAEHGEDDVVRERFLGAVGGAEADGGGVEARDGGAEPELHGAGRRAALHIADERGAGALVGGLANLDGRVGVGGEGVELLDVAGLGPRELFFPVAQRDVRAARAERDGRLERAVAAADHKHVFAGVFLGVVEAVENLAEFLAGDAEFAVVAAAADGHDDPPRAGHVAVRAFEHQRFAVAREALDARGRDLDAGGAALRFHLGEQRFLYVGGEVQAAVELHVGGVGEDGFRLGKIGDGGEDLGGLEDGEVQAGTAGLDGRGDAGDAAADDGQIEGFWFPVSGFRFAEFGGDFTDGAGAGVGGKLQQRHAGEVADDADAGQVGAAVFVASGQFFHRASGPAGVEPMGVAGE